MTTIAQERAALKRVGRSLISRESAGFRFARYGEARAVSEPASLVFVHITITNPKNYASDAAHARAVEAIGISRFPNTGISYNRLIMQSGRAYEGQPIGRRGAHTVNDKNLTKCASTGCPSKGGAIPSAATNLNNVVRAYAICQNVGDIVTPAQLDSLARTIAADILAGFVKRGADIHGHRCVAPKDCPAAKMWAQMGKLQVLVDKYVSVGVAPAPSSGDVTSPSGGNMAFDTTEVNQIRAAVQAELEEFRPKFRADMQAENEEYGVRFWVLDSGTGKVHVIDALSEVGQVLTDHTNRLIRIEDDTDGTPAP